MRKLNDKTKTKKIGDSMQLDIVKVAFEEQDLVQNVIFFSRNQQVMKFQRSKKLQTLLKSLKKNKKKRLPCEKECPCYYSLQLHFKKGQGLRSRKTSILF